MCILSFCSLVSSRVPPHGLNFQETIGGKARWQGCCLLFWAYPGNSRPQKRISKNLQVRWTNRSKEELMSDVYKDVWQEIVKRIYAIRLDDIYLFMICCIVACTTWLPVSWKYKRRRDSQARQTEADAEKLLWRTSVSNKTNFGRSTNSEGLIIAVGL